MYCAVPPTKAVGRLLLRSFWADEAIFQLMIMANNLFLLFKMDFVRESGYLQQIKTILSDARVCESGAINYVPMEEMVLNL
jgi:hypothetical protein